MMPIAFLLMSTLLFAAIAIQDFRRNEFYWFLLPAILLIGIFKGIYEVNFEYWLTTTYINLLMLFAIAIMLVGYYAVVKRLSIFKKSLGLGDILLLLVLTTFFQPILFVLVLLLSAVSGLAFHTVRHGLRAQKLIPYAAWLSIYTIVFYVYEFRV